MDLCFNNISFLFNERLRQENEVIWPHMFDLGSRRNSWQKMNVATEATILTFPELPSDGS